MSDIHELVDRVRVYDASVDEGLLQRAYAFADEAHRGQKRTSGEPYITHCYATALNLADMRMPPSIVIAGLLHDVPEDTHRTIEEIEAAFGPEVASMVGGITKLGKLKYRGMERYLENLRKMFLAMAADVRVVIIKFADRLHNLETLDVLPQKKQYRVALESLEIFAPIANRLGMGEMKGRIEDLSFKYVYPKEHAWTVEVAKQTRDGKMEYLDRVIRMTQETLAAAGIKNVAVHGRAKHLYSLYRKLVRHDRDIARIYDLMAIRVVVPTVADCYAALGVIHGTWTPLKGRIKDYIAQPKPNGYRSLHTTVFCEDGEIVEFQIRTQEMHNVNEFGIAAHWQYDEKKGGKHSEDEQTKWMAQLAELQQEIADKRTYLHALEELKIDVFRDRIFVFTPSGDVIDLPEDSTPVDFAYAIHTDIGNTCMAAKVNDDMTTLDRPLKSGDIIEILVDKSRKGPNPDWIHFVKTRHAKACIRSHTKTGVKNWIKGLLPGGKN
jgi:guanosine-3',5'-bis(diphosphate) 3'-pyrophosphohydrolase